MERSAIRGGEVSPGTAIPGFRLAACIQATKMWSGWNEVESGGARLTLQSPPSAGARCGARQVPVNSFGHGRLHTVGVRSGKPWSVPYFPLGILAIIIGIVTGGFLAWSLYGQARNRRYANDTQDWTLSLLFL